MTFPQIPAREDSTAAVSFNAHDVELPGLLRGRHAATVISWLAAVAKTHDAQLIGLDYVLCDDAFLHAMNVEHLGHDTLTDIITFDLGEGGTRERAPTQIVGECYVSLERVTDNAVAFGRDAATSGAATALEAELLRVFAHGLLHLCGLGDATPEEVTRMRDAEERALYIWRAEFGSGDTPV